MKVNELAKEVGINADTVRFYAKEGLLYPVKLEQNGYYDYSENDRRLLRFIVSARHIGFTLADIKDLFALIRDHNAPCPSVGRLIVSRLYETRKGFEDTRLLREMLLAATEKWGAAPTGTMIQSLIDEFAK